MFQRLFFTVYDNNNVATSNRLQVSYNGAVVKEWDFPLDTVLTEDQQDQYVAQKFGEILTD